MTRVIFTQTINQILKDIYKQSNTKNLLIQTWMYVTYQTRLYLRKYMNVNIVVKYLNTIHHCQDILNIHVKKNEDEDFKELARLMNEKDRYLVEVIKDNNNQMNKMYKQIEKLKNKLQIQNINNGIINNNTINIQLLNHGESDYSHITPTDYISCIKSCNKCVKQLIEKVHFNNGKPENMNIYLSNIKGNI